MAHHFTPGLFSVVLWDNAEVSAKMCPAKCVQEICFTVDLELPIIQAGGDSFSSLPCDLLFKDNYQMLLVCFS